MSMYKSKALLGLFALAAMGGGMGAGAIPRGGGEPVLLPAERVDRRRKLLLKKGCKVFTIEGIEIVALNERSARKKYEKMFKVSEGRGNVAKSGIVDEFTHESKKI